MEQALKAMQLVVDAHGGRWKLAARGKRYEAQFRSAGDPKPRLFCVTGESLQDAVEECLEVIARFTRPDGGLD